MVDQRCQKIKKVIKVVFQDYRKLFKPTHRSSFIFFLPALQIFTSYSKFLQRGHPLSHKVYPLTKELIKKISMRFLKTDIIREEVYLEILGNEEHYLPLENVFLGYYRKRNFEQKTKSRRHHSNT